ncbi:FUSC family protein [Paenibacillus pasadenensis]|uniref:Putative lipoprotein n=1 Tax=Paenibacillus pasadenensis TaxID=217090 RepID=A0A2N5NC03_9BACL|nr:MULTISPECIES: aromatic acid exporter family protein [Paenibacillus]PLT47865.1 putative lipoprotein [Paenibacillus pasadenensis]QGG58023.1 hypothetical protein GE073_22250 [Paenibacillus sp. B01]
MTIGARVLKTGMAVALAIYLSGLFGFVNPILSAVSAIFTLQPSIFRSWQQVSDQFQTNLLGAAIALGAVQLIGNSPITVGIVCIAVILISIKLKMEATVGLTLVTVVAVMEANSTGWMFAVERFLQVLTGMGAAFAVNVLIFPPSPRRQFHDLVHQSYAQLSLLLRTSISDEMREQVYNAEKDKLQGTIGRLEERFKVLEDERSFRASSRAERARQLLLARQLIRVVNKGADLLEVVEEHYFSAPGAEAWAGRMDAQIEELTKYHEFLLLKLDNKVKPGSFSQAESITGSSLARQLTDYLRDNPEEHRRLVFVASALFEYGYHLRRLEKVIEQVQTREAEGASSRWQIFPLRGKD